MRRSLKQLIAMSVIIAMIFTTTPIPTFASMITYADAIASEDFTSYYSSLVSQINNLGITSTTSTADLQLVLTDNEADIERLELISACGVSTLNAFATESENNKAFLNWLFSNTEAMKKFLTNGTPRDNRVMSALTIWEQIYRTDVDSRNGLYLTLAVAVVLEHANAVDTSWYSMDEGGSGYVIDPISRYNNFKTAHEAGKLYSVFDTLNVTKMRLVVDAWLSDSDLDWARTTYSGNHSVVSEKGVTRTFDTVYDRSNISNSGYELEYNSFNAAGISVQDGALKYYGANANLMKVLSVGGVCGAIAKYGTAVAKAFGVPAIPEAQPGHAAGIVNNVDGQWTYHNNIYGMGESFTHPGVIMPWGPSTRARYVKSDGTITTNDFGPAYVLLYEAAYVADTTADKNGIAQSELLRLLAKELVDTSIAQNVRTIAMGICQYNIQIWRDYISTLQADSSFSDWTSIKNNIITTFSEHPRPMTELLTSIETKLLESADETMKSNYVNEVWGVYEAVTDAQQVSIRDIIERSLEPWKYEYLPKPTITFSFSGDNESKLMGFIKGMSYSVDGGSTFLTPSDSDYKFKINEINNMSEHNGILVRNKYSTTTDVSKMAVINITNNTGGDISVTGDDVTNSISGLDTTMQFSINNGGTWTSYDGTNTPDLTGNLILLVRRSGNALMMPSRAVELIYTNPANLALNKQVVASNSYNSTSFGVKNVVDGNGATLWTSGTKATPQSIYVDLGSLKNINGVKLKWNANVYGYAKSYKIQVSNDALNWIDVFSTTSGDGNTDYINVEMVTARYVRLYATEIVESYKWSTLAEFEVYDGTDTPSVWKQTDVTYLSDLVWSNCDHPGKAGPGLDMSYNYWGYESPKDIYLKGKRYLKGLGAYANSTIQYKLDGKYTTFSTDIGIDDKASGASPVIFEVIKDATTVYKSDQITDTTALQHIEVDVTGASLLTLKVTPIYLEKITNDNADWANAYLRSASDLSNPTITSIEPNGIDISQNMNNLVLHFDDSVTGVTGKQIFLVNNGIRYSQNAEKGSVGGSGINSKVTLPLDGFKDASGKTMAVKEGNLYSLLVGQGAFIDGDTHLSEAVYGDLAFRVVDGPRVTGILPASTDVVTKEADHLVIAFDSTVTTVNGKYVTINLEGNSYVAQPLDSQITGIGNACKVTIPFVNFKDILGNSMPFLSGKNCNVSVEFGAFKNESGTTNNDVKGYVFTYDIVISADDTNNTIVGMDTALEFSINNGVTWKSYTGSNLPDLSGNIAIKVRKAAVGSSPAGEITELIFTGTGSANDMVKKLPNVTYLSDLTWASTPTNAWGSVEKDTSNGEGATGDGKNININGVTYTKGLGCYATSTIEYNIAKNYSRFITDVGVDNESNGTVKFEVLGDDVSLYKSTANMTKTTDAAHIDLNVDGVNKLTLKVLSGGDGNAGDLADWAGAYLVPIVTYAVTYDAQNEGTPETISLTAGSHLSAPTEPAKTGFVFGGWYKESTYATLWDFTNDTIIEDMTLYAKWTAVTPPPLIVYVVTYDAQNGTPPTTVSATSGSALTVTVDPIQTGFTFGGWYRESTCTTPWHFATDTVTLNMTLYAKWTAVTPPTPPTPPTPTVYVVTYDAQNGTTPTTVSATSGSALTVTVDPTQTGFTFGGWYKESACTTPWHFATDTVTSNMTLYAKWTAVTPPTPPTLAVYVVTYDAQNGMTPATVSATSGSALTVTADPTQTGFTFGGWYRESTCTTPWHFATDTVTSNMTLYAKWTALDVTLSATSIVKGQSISGLGVPNAVLGHEAAGSVTLSALQAADISNAGDFVTKFEKNDLNVAVKVVKYVSGTSTMNFETDEAYANQAVHDGDFFIIKVFVNGTKLVNYYKLNVAVAATSDENDKNDSTKEPSSTGDNVIQNETQSVPIVPVTQGTETKTTENGKSTVTVVISTQGIEDKINEVVKDKTIENNRVVQVVVEDTSSDVAKVELTGDLVKKLEVNTFGLSVKRGSIEYLIPAKELTISNVAKEFGVSEQSLQDIKIEVQITKLDASVTAKYYDVAKENSAELIFPPVAFEIIAKTTKSDGTKADLKIDKFSNFVERVIEIPNGVDTSKITTGIVFNADGSYSQVPTVLFQENGKWFAKLNSLTNSNYSIIWNPVVVKSVEQHWAKEAVNSMASRLIIFNPNTFEPNKAITRGDFAEYIVRALGLYRTDSAYANKFKDVSAADKRTLAILIANEYGIVSGYADGTFRADNQITREEAMTMYSKALQITNLVGADVNRYQNYTDYNQVDHWAMSFVKSVLSTHVFNGTSETTLSPKAMLTYAEAAQAIQNLLIESKLINK